jgi:hypothetical protein
MSTGPPSRGYSGWDVALTTHLHLALRLKQKSIAIPLIPSGTFTVDIAYAGGKPHARSSPELE